MSDILIHVEQTTTSMYTPYNLVKNGLMVGRLADSLDNKSVIVRAHSTHDLRRITTVTRPIAGAYKPGLIATRLRYFRQLTIF